MTMKKKRQTAETEETLSAAIDDRVSQLPIPIRHHILCFLSQKEAVKTCLLSKQWRHIGSTRPNLEFSEEWFDDTQEKFVSVNRSIGSTRPNLNASEKNFNTTHQTFVSVVNRILHGYLDQNLFIDKLYLCLSRPVSRPVISLLDKWIPIIAALNIKAFKLNFLSFPPPYYNLPSAVFLAESLEELHLCKCKLSPVESVRFKCLRTLTLDCVQVDGGTLETKALGCPMLRRLDLSSCWELRNVRLSEAPGLKHFALTDFKIIEGRSIEIDVPNLETVSIGGPWIWSDRQSTFMFSRLTSLYLWNVILSSESIDMLSFRCPTLENLSLTDCSGFEEFHLASDSVMYLNISTIYIPLKGVTICAPNIVRFNFTAGIPQVPDTFSFTTTTSKQWYSGIFLYSYEEDPDFDVNWWFLELRRMLKALSGSQISLILHMDGGPLDMPWGAVDSSRLFSDEPPVVMENLKFSTSKCRTASWHSGFTNALFRVCRPRSIWSCTQLSQSDWNTHRLSEFQFNILLANMSLGTEPYFWRHDLEQVHVTTLYGQLIQWTDLSELRNRTYDRTICLKLKWRGQTTA
ncbi:F-box/RNI-like superfamily protein [Striga asiatica]|uniref:F-box/RNI-like superfamily protein n=1 Tax=Striga asiatica TaxID=4170 RepID=A0A5A7Q6K9_STRAF|nr:F-box/RNI-like superfamily protein [Striga asiatica]